jgi:DNA-directed RNA polymerase sigma subunit (sigma70/sigma32)
MLPEIEQRLKSKFRQLDAASKDEAVGEGIAHALLAYVRLHEQNRPEVASARSLACYSARQVKSGRPAIGRMNNKEPLSLYAQLEKGICVDRSLGEWIDKLVEDKRAGVPEQVAAKLDFRAWWNTLTQHMKRIAKDLAFGFSTKEVAAKYGVTAGRISQLRRELLDSWRLFQGEVVG